MGSIHEQGTAVQKRAEIRLEALTGLRFLAAAHVLFFHAGLAGLPGVPVWIKNVAAHADLSVSLFFVLSGFILTYNYFDPVRGCRTSDREFWVARFARVYPVYLLGLVLAIPLLLNDLAQEDGTPLVTKIAAIVLVVVLLQSWLPQTAWLWNFPAWSLSDEAFFYWAFPGTARRLRGLRQSQIIIAMAAVWLVAQAPPVIAQVLGPDGVAVIPESAMSTVMRGVQMNPLLRLPDFVIGILLGRFYLLYISREQQEQLPLRRLGPVFSIGGLALSIAAVAVSAEYPFPLTWSRSLLAPLNAMLIFGLALGGGFLWKLLNTRALVLLGNASYALYLLHIPVIFWTLLAARSWFGVQSPECWEMFAAYVIVAVGVSILAFLVVEEPMRHLLRQLIIRRLRARAGTEHQTVAARN